MKLAELREALSRMEASTELSVLTCCVRQEEKEDTETVEWFEISSVEIEPDAKTEHALVWLYCKDRFFKDVRDVRERNQWFRREKRIARLNLTSLLIMSASVIVTLLAILMRAGAFAR